MAKSNLRRIFGLDPTSRIELQGPGVSAVDSKAQLVFGKRNAFKAFYPLSAVQDIQDVSEVDVFVDSQETLNTLNGKKFFSETITSVEFNPNIQLLAENSVIINQSTVNGSKGSSNAKILLSAPEIFVKDVQVSYGCTAYNIFEGTQNITTLFRKLEFIGVSSFASITHNVFSFYTPADDAEIIIKNCQFSLDPETSNIIRLANYANSKNVKIVFENVDWTYEKYPEKSFDYAGALLYQPAANDVAGSGDLSAISTWSVEVVNCTYNGEKVVDNGFDKHSRVVYTYGINGQGVGTPEAAGIAVTVR